MIIRSIVDLDLYKLTQQYAIIKHFPWLKVKYKFTDRNNTVYPIGFDLSLLEEVKKMETLSLTTSERDFLSKNHGETLPPTYLDFLSAYRFDSSELKISMDDDNHLMIEVEGYWYKNVLWETILMSLISELYFKMTNQIVDLHKTTLNDYDTSKIKTMVDNNVSFTDFGTRRRFSYENQDRIIKLFSEYENDELPINGEKVFKGTSNVHFGHKYGLKIFGTLGHEFTMVMGTLYGYEHANTKTCDVWLDTYPNGKLSTILPDTYTTDVFMRTFDYGYASQFHTIRQDSGSPFVFTDKVLEKYKKLNIDSKYKTIMFSDSLNCERSIELKKYCKGKIKSTFGIGTFLTNDLPDIKPLNIVIKISEVLVDNVWKPAIKLSDNVTKITGDSKTAEVCKSVLGIN